jgi:hypothetical protein
VDRRHTKEYQLTADRMCIKDIENKSYRTQSEVKTTKNKECCKKLKTGYKFNVPGFVHRKNILIYIQQDALLHSLFYPENAPRVSGGTTSHHQECKQLYLQHLVFVTPLLLPAAIVEELEPV